MNIAARLEQAAPPGEVFVGEATWALVAHAVDGEPVAAVPAKGKSEPLTAWRLEAVDTAAVAQRRRLDLPMVGRESEAPPAALGRRANRRGEQAAPGHHARAGGHREVPARLRAAPPP